MSVESSFGNDSSKDSSYFNISNISESINSSYNSVTERPAVKKLERSYENAQKYNSKEAYFPDCSFGNCSKEEGLNKSIGSEKLETNSSFCEEPLLSLTKKESSINFTKKFKYYRENTPSSSQVKKQPMKRTPAQSARNSLIAYEQERFEKPEKLALGQFNLLKEIG